MLCDLLPGVSKCQGLRVCFPVCAGAGGHFCPFPPKLEGRLQVEPWEMGCTRHTPPAALSWEGFVSDDTLGAGASSAFLGRKYQKGALVSGFLRGLRTVVLYLGSPTLDLWCHLGGGEACRQAVSSGVWVFLLKALQVTLVQNLPSELSRRPH